MSSFQPSPAFALANRAATVFLRWGFPMGTRKAPMALLTVRGRRTGIERNTPVALERRDEGWLLIAVYGVSDWSRNLEAAGSASISRRRRVTEVTARRLPPDEAAPILRDSVGSAPALVRRMTAPYFTATGDSPLEEWEQEAVVHPVFILTPATSAT